MVFTELINRSHCGDLSAKEELVRENTGLVYMVVNRFRGRGLEMEDLFQIGTVGLLKSIDGFDPNYGVQFSTYAVPMILGEVKRYLRDNRLVSVSRSYKTLAAKAQSLSQSIFLSTGQEPTISELATKLSVAPEELSLALSAAREPLSLEEPQKDSDLTLKETLPDTSPLFDTLDHVALRDSVNKLPPRDRLLLYLRYFRGETQTKVAARLGISQVQVSRLEKKIIKELRKNMF